MAGRGLEPTAPQGASPGGGPPGWRRRRYVVDARYQLRAGALVGGAALVLLILLNVSLISHGRAGASVAEPAAHRLAAGQSGTSFALLMLGSLTFIAGVILIGLLESHRTAGAAFAIRRAVDEIREGKTEIRVRLRRRDHLQELARSINRLAETIDGERARRG